jgi:hypothetical protein
VTVDGDVIAVVTPRIGDGPLNVVVDEESMAFSDVEPGMPARVDKDRLQFSALEIVLDRAVVWEPRPDWEALRARRTRVLVRLPLVRHLCLQLAPSDSFLALLERTSGKDVRQRVILATARSGARALGAGWEADRVWLQEGTAQLAGLGGGLTPAGDDFLAGVMLWAWLAHPRPDLFCRIVVEAAISRTTTLSAALLRTAARGECGSAWHALLAALAWGDYVELAEMLRVVLSQGGTSGADALSGFLWMARGSGR